MKWLRLIIGLYGVLCIIGAFILIQYSKGTGNLFIAGYILVNTSLLIAGLLFERGRYKPQVDLDQEGWQLTGERFIDQSTGKMMEVRYNTKSGERDYSEVKGR